jgi:ribosomal protein S6--L-glutamate ligase
VRLAVANRTETFERIREPLADRGIKARHVPYHERTVDLADPPFDRAFDAGFVYPGRLMEGAVVDAFLDVPWVNGRADVLTSRNKAGALATLSEAGIPVPETVLVSNPTEPGDPFERFGPPVVVKPNSTTRGIGVTRVGDPDTFAGVTDYLDLVHDFQATDDKSYLVQEYLPDARDYRVMVIDGEYAGAVERDSPGWRHNVHRGATARGVDLDPELRDLAERAAAALDIRVLGVDLLVTDHRAVVNETNARPTVDDAEKYEPDFYDRLAAAIRATGG